MLAGSLRPLDVALYALLNGNVQNHAGANVPVYDDAPQGQAFPYVTFTSDTSIPWDDHSDRGAEITRTITVWSRFNGFQEATAIAASIATLLDRRQADLNVSGWRVVYVLNEMNERLKDPDGLTRRVITRYRFHLEPTS